MRFPYTALLGAAWVFIPAYSALPEADPVAAGQLIYRQGLLPGGFELTAVRDAGTRLTGDAAACVNCHRRSGLGTAEGSIVIPPIIAKYLYRSRSVNTEDLTLPHVPGWAPHDWTYNDETLARVIRTGERPDGQSLSRLMPHYSLDDASMAALIDYLKELTSLPTPGVTDTTLDFATIITPDADPVAKNAMLAVLNRFFAIQENGIGEDRSMNASHEIMYRVARRWRLHVWELTGPADAWERQLEDHLSVEPVFAVISGIGGRDWRPIHRFCQRWSIPCLLPNIDLPVVSEQDFYPIYYSRGVLLEADLIAARLTAAGRSRPARIVQIYRLDDIGAGAAARLEMRARTLGLSVLNRPLRSSSKHSGATASKELKHAIADVDSRDWLVFWLRSADLASLGGKAPIPDIYASGLMGGLESAPVPGAWRGRMHLTYPFDLPEQRRVRMNFPMAWFRAQGISVTAERIQTDTYLSCVILSEVLGHLLDSFVRDYLVERTEMMLSQRLLNGYYPRLGLAPGQRFASKGGYLVHFSNVGNKIIPEGDWITP